MQSIYSVHQNSFLSQVTTLVNTSNKGPSTKKKGRSKKAHVLAVSVEQATQNFLEKGEQIAKDSQDLKEELIAAVEDVRKQGKNVACTYVDRMLVLLILSCNIFLGWGGAPLNIVITNVIAAECEKCLKTTK